MSERYPFRLLRFGACVSAEAATDFTAFDDFGSRSSFDALVATVLDVFSFGDFRVAMPLSLFAKCKCRSLHRSDMEKGGNHGSPLVHRHRPSGVSAPKPVDRQALEHPFNMVVRRVISKREIRQMHGLINEVLGLLFVHRHMVRCFRSFLNSHFPIPDFFVHGSTLCRADQGRNTEIQQFQGAA